ncbi:tetratricopeptide repeat-containing sulfotransferase family protein [Arenicella chitinivorans]
MRAGEFEAARASLAALLEESPDDPELHYLTAVCCRYLANYDAALESLGSLKRLSPDHSRGMQEQGHLLVAVGEPRRALEAYARATQLNPALIPSWRAQIKLLAQLKLNAQAESVALQTKRIAALPTPLLHVIELRAQGKLLKAEQLCRRFLQTNPTHVEGMRQLADIGVRLGILEDAEFLLESALQLDQGHVEVTVDYIQVLRKRQKHQRALEQARSLTERFPSNPQFRSLFAIESMQVGDYPTAIENFDRVLQALPDEPATLTSQGHAFKTMGNQAAAVDNYRRALAANSRHCEAWYSLANLKTVRFTRDDFNAMQSLQSDPLLVSADQIYLHFALGKAHEDRDEYEASFRHYAKGNELKRLQSRYDAQQMADEFRAIQHVCNASYADRIARGGCPAADPIFIVGLPRSGSTLLEQILSSHSQVDGTLELPNILALAHSLRRGDRLSNESHYPAVLATLTEEQRVAFGQQYLDDTRVHRAGAHYFIDKMPNNFRHIGLIKAILPNAKIIDARRDPMACCFSGFKQLFAEGQEFSYSLHDIGRYYRDYEELMTHWRRVFPDSILHVQYEDVVNDLEGQVRRILHYCGLPFETACLDFHATQRAVRTASSEQVRRPINTDGLDQWRHYAPWLDPLVHALENT